MLKFSPNIFNIKEKRLDFAQKFLYPSKIFLLTFYVYKTALWFDPKKYFLKQNVVLFFTTNFLF